MAEITLTNGTIKPVKNLGWLLKHRHDVIAVYVYGAGGLKAILANGTVYRTSFADMSILRNFVAKRWLDITVFSHKMYENEREYSDKHYIAMSSSGGATLADNCAVHKTYSDAVHDLSDLWELDNDESGDLYTYGKVVYHGEFAAHLLEVVECDCKNPYIHQDEYASESQFNDEFYSIIPDELPMCLETIYNPLSINDAIGFSVRGYKHELGTGYRQCAFEYSTLNVCSAIEMSIELIDKGWIVQFGVIDRNNEHKLIAVYRESSRAFMRQVNLLSLAYFMGIYNPTKGV
jgi:hypothetical protein